MLKAEQMGSYKDLSDFYQDQIDPILATQLDPEHLQHGKACEVLID